MAIERFRRSRAGRVANIPNIRPVAAQEAARSAQSFSQAMDRVSRFAFSEAQEQYQAESKTRAAEIIQEKGAVPAIQEIVEQGGPQDLVEETVYEVGNRIATVRIGSMAKASMNQLVLDAEQNNTSFEELDQQINDVVLGYTSALEEYSPEAALEARIELESNAATYKNNFAEAFQKRQIEELQGEALAAYESERQAYIAAAIEDVPPEVRQENLAKRRDNIEQLFIDAGFKPTTYQKTLINLDEEAKESQVLMDFNNLESVEQKEAYIENLRDNPIPELGVDGTRVLRNNLIGELNKAESGRRSVVNTALDQLDSFITIARAGGEVNQEQVTQIGALAEQYPELQVEFQEKTAMLQNIQAFRSMPPVALERTINEMRSEGIETEFQAEMVDLAETTLSNMQTRSERDPISAYIEFAGEDAPAAFQLGSVEEMNQSIQERVELANKASDFFGVETKYLTDAEANQLTEYINTLNPTEKAQVALGMSAMPPEVWTQVADKDQGIFAMTSAIGDSLIATRVFEGQTLIRDKLVEMPSRSEQAGIVNDTLGDVYGEKDRRDIVAAARAYYASTVEDRAFYDENTFEAALQQITGGITEINGFKVQLPRDMGEDEFDQVVSNFSPEMVDRFGGLQGMTNEEAAELIRDLPLENDGNNAYFPKQAGQLLLNNDGEPFRFVVDDRFRAMAARQFERTSPARVRSRVAESMRTRPDPREKAREDIQARQNARRRAREEMRNDEEETR